MWTETISGNNSKADRGSAWEGACASSSWVGFRFLKWIVLILSERTGSPVFLLTGGPG